MDTQQHHLYRPHLMGHTYIIHRGTLCPPRRLPHEARRRRAHDEQVRSLLDTLIRYREHGILRQAIHLKHTIRPCLSTHRLSEATTM